MKVKWKPGIYDAIDMGHAYGAGYWSGAIASALSILLLCALVGYYLI